MATYGSVTGVQALVPSPGTFSTTTKPTLAQVTAWLAEGYAIINRYIATAGFTTPVVVGVLVAASDELAALNNLYAGAYVLRSLGIDTASGDAEERSEVWLRNFYAQLKDLAASNLALLGLTPLPAATASRRRRIRTLQMRKVDGYSRGNTDETWEVQQGEYTYPNAPSE